MKRLVCLILAAAMLLCGCVAIRHKDDGAATAPASEPTAEPTTEPTTKPAEPDYKVTVLDEGGNPVVGAWVQLCVEDGTCTPASTNDQGVAGFNLDTYNYKVSFMVLPEGYAYTSEQDTWYFEDGKTEMTIVLKAVG